MRFLHAMLRVSDPEATIRFFNLLGLDERRRMDNEAGRYTLIFLGVAGDEGGEVELTWNWKSAAIPAGATSAISPIRSTTFTTPAAG
jgi:lactoylglutathione lyase